VRTVVLEQAEELDDTSTSDQHHDETDKEGEERGDAA